MGGARQALDPTGKAIGLELPMNFDDALKHYWPQAWFRFKFIKYKYLGRGEPELKLLRYLVQPGSSAIDVGASIGMYSAEMARHAARVVAFEANPDIAAFLCAVAPRNVQVINAALSSQAGRATLSMPRNRKGGGVSELATLELAAPRTDTIAIEVETRRLDDFAMDDCSFIKIDVEGHEEAVIAGAEALIARHRPALMVELIEALNPGAIPRLSRQFAQRSYDCLFLSGGVLKPVAEFDLTRDQDTRGPEYIVNFIFVPAERRERVRALLP
jgi:FkbM family methyltransferase